MPTALLDFPWTLPDLLDPYSEALDVVRRFDDLVREYRVTPAPFVDDAALAEFFQLTNEYRFGKNTVRPVFQFLNHCRWEPLSIHRANPNPSPHSLHAQWKRALRDSMGDLTDWRTPQIVTSASRVASWAPQEGQVALTCEDAPAGVHLRILVDLDSYAEHRFALSDFDPWDLRRRHPAGPAGRVDHPCRLPKPPLLHGISLQDLPSKLKEAQRADRPVGAGRYFIPADDWNPTAVTSTSWRSGRVFPESTLNGRTGPVDYHGHVWHWDNQERHWDVQEGVGLPHVRVSHSGAEL